MRCSLCSVFVPFKANWGGLHGLDLKSTNIFHKHEHYIFILHVYFTGLLCNMWTLLQKSPLNNLRSVAVAVVKIFIYNKPNYLCLLKSKIHKWETLY